MFKIFKATTLIAILWVQSLISTQAQETVESGHLAVENPAELSQLQANKIYNKLRKDMAKSYALSRLSVINDYQSWTRYNSAPYLSATHGQRFVNNFANEKAKFYGKLKTGQTYPVGSVFAKDSLTITDGNKIFPGAMFVMEKLAAGSNNETANWRYVVVLPDGTQYGDTTGEEPEQVKYCHACHEAKAKEDYVFFVPKELQLIP